MARISRTLRKNTIHGVFITKEGWQLQDLIGILRVSGISYNQVQFNQVEVFFYPLDIMYFQRLGIPSVLRSSDDPVKILESYIMKKNLEIRQDKDEEEEEEEERVSRLEEKRVEIENVSASKVEDIPKGRILTSGRNVKEPSLFSHVVQKPSIKGRSVKTEPRDLKNKKRELLAIEKELQSIRDLKSKYPRSFILGELRDEWGMFAHIRRGMFETDIEYFSKESKKASMIIQGMEVEIQIDDIKEEYEIIRKLENKNIKVIKKGIFIYAGIPNVRERRIFSFDDAEAYIKNILGDSLVRAEGEIAGRTLKSTRDISNTPRNVNELYETEKEMGFAGEFTQTTKYGDIEPLEPTQE